VSDNEPIIAFIAIAAVVLVIIIGWYKNIWERRQK
jgi:hypothetical protein